MDIHISKAQYSNIDELEQLYDDLNDYLAANTNYPGWIKGIYPTRKEALHFFETNTLYVANSNGRLVGSFALTHEPEKEPGNGSWLIEADYENIFVIHVFVVHPDFLRNGIGTAMLQFAEQISKQEKIKSIRLDVYEKNTAAIKAYEKNGYVYIDKVDIGLGNYGLNWFYLYEKVIVPS